MPNPSFTLAATCLEPSAFMSTTVHSPFRIFHVSGAESVEEAAQMPAVAGEAGRFVPANESYF